MMREKGWITVAAVALALGVTAPCFGYIEMAYTELPPPSEILGSDATWVECGSVTFKAPKDGFVVVTVSGGVDFMNVTMQLQLTLAEATASRGPWSFVLPAGNTPGVLFKSFSFHNVFPVTKKQTYSFYLNANSFAGGGSAWVGIAHMTAQFFPKNKVSAPAP